MATTIDELQVLITAQNKQFQKALREVSAQLDGVSGEAQKAGSQMSAGFEKVNTMATKALKVGVVAAVAAVTASIPAAVRRIDTLNNSARTFENMGFKSEASSKAVDELVKSITGLPTPLDSAMRGMTALAATYGDVELGQKVFSSLNNAILGFGGSASMVDNAIMQLSQLPMDGPLDAQTWNSLRNSGLTPVLVAMAKDSKMSVSQMKEAFGSGQLTVQDFTSKLIEMNEKGGGGLKSLQQIAKDSTAGIGTGFENMKTAITRGVATIIEAIGSANISNAIASIGTAFESVLVAVAGLVAFIAANGDVFAPLAVGVTAAVTAIVAYNTYVKISTVITAAWSAASTYMTLVTSLQAQGLGVLRAAWLALNIVMKANPIGLVITAVIAITSALVYFATQTETGKKIFETAMNAIKTAAQTVWNWIKGNWPLLLAILTGPVGTAVVLIIKNIDTIKKGFSTALSSIKTVWNSAPGFFSGVVSNIGTNFNRIRSYVKSAFDRAVSAIKSIDWSGIGVNIIKGIGGGIASMGGWLADQAKAAVGGAKDKLKSFLGIHSPSRVMRDEIGKMMGLGMAEGIDASTKYAVKSAADSASRVMSAYSGMSVDLPTSKELSGRLDVEFNSKLSKVDSRLIPVNVQLDGETLLRFVIDGVNGKSFMSNHSVIDY